MSPFSVGTTPPDAWRVADQPGNAQQHAGHRHRFGTTPLPPPTTSSTETLSRAGPKPVSVRLLKLSVVVMPRLEVEGFHTEFIFVSELAWGPVVVRV